MLRSQPQRTALDDRVLALTALARDKMANTCPHHSTHGFKVLSERLVSRIFVDKPNFTDMLVS